MPTSPPLLSGNSLGWLDYLVIALYLGVNVGIGWWVQRQKRNTGADYFLGGGRVPPWASAISWYGTAVSSVSFMALPAYAYSKDWLPMVVGPAGSGVGIIVAYGFLGIPDPPAVAAMRLAHQGPSSLVIGETGIAGLAGALVACSEESMRKSLGLGPESKVVAIACEGPTDLEVFHRLLDGAPA